MVEVGLHNGGARVANWAAALSFEGLNADGVRAAFVDLANVERSLAAARARLIERAVQTDAHKELGLTNVNQLVAKYFGVSTYEASNIVKTAESMTSLPDLESAVANGEISERQAMAIRKSGVNSPDEVHRLVELAKHGSVKELDEEAAALSRGSSVEEERERRAMMRAQRRMSFASSDMAHIRATLLNEEGAQFKTVFDRYRNRVLKASGKDVPFNQIDADAFMLMVGDIWRAGNGELIAPHRVDTDAMLTLLEARGISPAPAKAGNQKRKRAKLPPPIAAMSIFVDYAALARGFLLPGEVCELPGVGPVNLEYALSVLDQSSLQFIIKNGKDIKTVTSISRSVSKHIKSALKARDKRCCVPGCDNDVYLEDDHIMPFAEGNPMSVDNGVRLCTKHHRMKTNKGWRLVGEPDAWEWCSPARVKELISQGRLKGDPNIYGPRLSSIQVLEPEKLALTG